MAWIWHVRELSHLCLTQNYRTLSFIWTTKKCGTTHADSEEGMLTGISWMRRMRSKIYWFSEFCNSQCLSHFAASFIVIQAKTSVAESCITDIHKMTDSIMAVAHCNTAVGGRARRILPVRSPLPLKLDVRQNPTFNFTSGNPQIRYDFVRMILPQVHLRKPCYDFSFL